MTAPSASGLCCQEGLAGCLAAVVAAGALLAMADLLLRGCLKVDVWPLRRDMADEDVVRLCAGFMKQ